MRHFVQKVMRFVLNVCCLRRAAILCRELSRLVRRKETKWRCRTKNLAVTCTLKDSDYLILSYFILQKGDLIEPNSVICNISRIEPLL